MKRSLSLVLALVMILGSFSAVFAAETTAVDAIERASKFLKEEGVLVGNDKGDLMLEDNLLRQDTAILVSKLMGEHDEAVKFEGTVAYEDIRNDFYLPVLAWAQANKTFVGHSDTNFGFGENITAQEYAKVLLTALGYKVAPNGDSDIKWADALVKAEEFGILADVEVENSTEITRGEMAVMTFNALGVTMKDSKNTLADKLGIELPEAPKAEKLEVEKVYTENLKEVVVKVNNAELIDEADVSKVSNYRLTLRKVNKVVIDEENNEIRLVLEKAYVKGDKDNLVIRNMNNVNRALNGNTAITATDNTRPVVLGAQYLGKLGIKVTMSEPIKDAQARQFRLMENGKDNNMVMDIKVYDREVVLTPYHKEEFDMEKHENLVVNPVTDFAGLSSEKVELNIEKAEEGYENAPEVESVKAYGTRLEVKFDKEILASTVKHYEKPSATGNVAYSVRGKLASYAKDSGMIDAYTAYYEFDRDLTDRFTDVTISGVKNHEDVEMVKVTKDVEIIQERIEPIVIREDIIDLGSNNAKIELEFDVEVDGILNDSKDTSKGFDFSKHFTLFETGLKQYQAKVDLVDYDEVLRDGEVGIRASYKQDNKNNDIKNIIVVELTGLRTRDTDKDETRISYILETERFENRGVTMFRQYTSFTISEANDKLVVIGEEQVPHVSYNLRNRIGELRLTFSEKLDRVSVENPRNYVFIDKNNNVKYLDDLGGHAELDRNGNRINLVFPEGLVMESYKELEIIKGIRSVDSDKVLQDTVKYNFVSGLASEIAGLTNVIRTGNDKYEGNVVDGATLKTGLKADITVRPAAGVTAPDFTIDASRAHVILDGIFGDVTVDAIGKDSVELKTGTTVQRLVVSVDVKVIGDVAGITEIKATEDVTVVVGKQTVKLSEGETVTVDANGKVQEIKVAVTSAVYNTDGATTVKFTVKDQDGEEVKVKETDNVKVYVEGKAVEGLNVTTDSIDLAVGVAKKDDKIVVEFNGHKSREYKVTLAPVVEEE